VIDRREDRLIFISHLEAVAAAQQRVINLGVEDVRVLKLRVAALVAELRVAADALDVQTANDGRIGGESRDTCHQAGHALSVRALAAVGAGEGETGIEDGVLSKRVSDTTGDLLVEDVDVAIAVAAGRPLNVRR